MFSRARLRLTAIYALLLGLTLLLVIGVIAALVTSDARRADDLQLRLRVQAVAQRLAAASADVSLPQIDTSQRDEPRQGDADDPDRYIESEGVLTFVLPVQDGVVQPDPEGSFAGLPSLAAAAAALRFGSGGYQNVTLAGGQLRLYSEPVLAGGQAVAVVQGARSRTFVEDTIRRLVVIALAAGLGGLVLSAAAGFWLAGLTLRPIAAAMERQRRFTADASHELRTPIAVIRGDAETLARHPERRIGDYQELVQDVLAESERLSGLVGGLLTLARADENDEKLELEKLDLSQLTADVAGEFARPVAEKALALKTAIEPGVLVRGDRARLRRIATILLENALRYTERGEIVVSVVRRHGEAVLAVQDTGPGIAPEHLPHVFERFYRANAARADAGGAGLGLAIAERDAALQHARLSVESQPGRGSTFAVHIPLGR